MNWEMVRNHKDKDTHKHISLPTASLLATVACVFMSQHVCANMRSLVCPHHVGAYMCDYFYVFMHVCVRERYIVT